MKNAGFGAFFLETEKQAGIESRKVYPKRLLTNSFVFEFPEPKKRLLRVYGTIER
jgi:hypothetical protein